MKNPTKPPRIPASVKAILEAENYGPVRLTVDQFGLIHVWRGERCICFDGPARTGQLWYELVSDARFPPGSAIRREFFALAKRIRNKGGDIAILAGLLPEGRVYDRSDAIVAHGRTGAELLESLRRVYPELA